MERFNIGDIVTSNLDAAWNILRKSTGYSTNPTRLYSITDIIPSVTGTIVMVKPVAGGDEVPLSPQAIRKATEAELALFGAK